MAARFNILLVRPWTLDTERIRASLRAAGLGVRLVNVDFPAALAAVLSREVFEAVIYDPETPGLGDDTLHAILREQNVAIPVIVLRDGADVGVEVAHQLMTLRN